jgi:hypothetical protein
MDDRDSARQAPPLPPLVAALLTFIATASGLVLEIAAGRLLAPYVGVSLTTYTGIIGAILAGIALGAWIGGRAADAVGPLPLLGPAFILGGISAIAAVPIVGLIGGVGLGEGLVGIVILATTAFVVPAAILSATAPMLVRGTLTDLATSGSIVGRLSAVGTVGAITGTFLTGFVLLGLFPTRVLIVAIGVGLAVIGAVLSLWLRRGGRGSALLAVAAVLLTGGFALAGPSPCDAESAYYCIASAAVGGFRTSPIVLRAWERSLECAAILRATAILLQCPASFRPSEDNIDRLRTFFGTVQRPSGLRTLWEPRGAWPAEVVGTLCRDLGLVHVVDPFVSTTVTPEHTYLRLHGTTGGLVSRPVTRSNRRTASSGPSDPRSPGFPSSTSARTENRVRRISRARDELAAPIVE